MLEQIKAVVIGHAVADALGVPVEFASREELDKAPVIEMEGMAHIPFQRVLGRMIPVCHYARYKP